MRSTHHLITLALFAVMSSPSLAQETAKGICKNSISSFLEDGDIIQKQEDIAGMPLKCKKDKAKQERAQETRDFFISQFKYPDALVDFTVSKELRYQQIPISSLGSFLFPSPSLDQDPQQIINRRLPQLLITNDYSQVSLENPGNNNYQLNVNLLSYMNWALNANVAGGYGDILKVKAETALKKTFQDKRSISIVYGYFQNRLASLFKDVEGTQRITKSKDFAPLFDLWLQYPSLDNDPNNKFVIDGFNALLIQEDRNATLLQANNASAQADANMNFPFLRLKGNAEFDWAHEADLSNNFSKVDLYFNGQPNFTPIPTKKQILETWKYITQDLHEIVYKEGKFLTISNFLTDDPIVRVIFGPLPSAEYKSDLAVRELSTANQPTYIQSLTIVDNPTVQDNNLGNGLYYLSIKVELNKEKIRTDTKINKHLVINTNIEVYYKKPCSIDGRDQYLSIAYPLYISLDTGPTLNITSVEPQIQNSKQNWKINLTASEPITDIQLNKVDFSLPNLVPFAQTIVNSSRISKPDQNNPSQFTIVTSANLLESSQLFGNEIPATFTFSISKDKAAPPILRDSKYSFFPLNYKQDKPGVQEIVRSNIDELKTYLPDTVSVFNRQNAKALLLDVNTSDSIKNKVYEELIIKGVIVPKNQTFALVKPN